jgi:hypothetical protein
MDWDWDKITLVGALLVALWLLAGWMPRGISPWIFGDRNNVAEEERTRLTQESRRLEPRDQEPRDRAP